MLNTGMIGLLSIFVTPLLGGLLAGFDRKLSARMQGRVGPPLLQPFFDVAKLMEKENLVVRRSQNFYIYFFLVFMIFTVFLFFSGEDLLLVIFSFMLAGIFFVLGGFKASSPFSFIGAQRELLLTMAAEPAVLMAAVGIYLVTGSFRVEHILSYPSDLALALPGVLFAFVYVVPNKLKKSPFDISMSHHAHQELVSGLATEFSGRALAAIEVAHWYETVLVLGICYLFFASNMVTGLLATLFIFILAIFVDNACARLRWQATLWTSWLIVLVASFPNIIILYLLRRG